MHAIDSLLNVNYTLSTDRGMSGFAHYIYLAHNSTTGYCTNGGKNICDYATCGENPAMLYPLVANLLLGCGLLYDMPGGCPDLSCFSHLYSQSIMSLLSENFSHATICASPIERAKWSCKSTKKGYITTTKDNRYCTSVSLMYGKHITQPTIQFGGSSPRLHSFNATAFTAQAISMLLQAKNDAAFLSTSRLTQDVIKANFLYVDNLQYPCPATTTSITNDMNTTTSYSFTIPSVDICRIAKDYFSSSYRLICVQDSDCLNGRPANISQPKCESYSCNFMGLSQLSNCTVRHCANGIPIPSCSSDDYCPLPSITVRSFSPVALNYTICLQPDTFALQCPEYICPTARVARAVSKYEEVIDPSSGLCVNNCGVIDRISNIIKQTKNWFTNSKDKFLSFF